MESKRIPDLVYVFPNPQIRKTIKEVKVAISMLNRKYTLCVVHESYVDVYAPYTTCTVIASSLHRHIQVFTLVNLFISLMLLSTLQWLCPFTYVQYIYLDLMKMYVCAKVLV